MFRPERKMGKPGDCLLASLDTVTDGPTVIGKPCPTTREIREKLKEEDAKREIEKECMTLSLTVAKTLDS